MGIAVRIIRLLGGPQAGYEAVSFLHRPAGSRTPLTATQLGCPVRFDQPWCGFELSSQMAARRIENADPETQRIATKYLEATYLPASAPLSDRVAELTRRLLPTGQCSAEAIADELAMHPRTLQRRLADEGVRCQDIIDRERRAQAARYLAEPGLHLSPDRRPARLFRTERAEPVVPALVRQDAAAMPGGRGAGVGARPDFEARVAALEADRAEYLSALEPIVHESTT